MSPFTPVSEDKNDTFPKLNKILKYFCNAVRQVYSGRWGGRRSPCMPACACMRVCATPTVDMHASHAPDREHAKPGFSAKKHVFSVRAWCHRGVVGGRIRDPRTKTSYASWFFGKLAVQSS